jgi:hypothetical protein
MLIRMTSGALFLALLLGLVVARIAGADEAFKNVAITMVIDGAFFLVYQYIPRLIAYANRWKYAARLHEYMGGLDSPRIDFDTRKRYQSYNSPCWVVFRVENHSKYPLEDCGIRIEKIEPPIFSSVSEDVWLEITNYAGKQKVSIPSDHSIEAIVVSWLGSEPRRDVLEFGTTIESEHGSKGQIQTYRVFLEITGVYLWEKRTYHKTVEVKPNHNDKSIEIEIISNGIRVY